MFFTITANGVKTVIDAENKAAANAYAANHSSITIEQSSKADFSGVDMSAVPEVLKGGYTQAEIDAEAAKKAERKAKAEAKKAAKV